MKRKFLFFLPSTWAFLKEGRRTKNYSLKNSLNGYIYGRWAYLYIAIGTGEHVIAKKLRPLALLLYRLFNPLKKKTTIGECVSFADTYHGKVISLDGAKQLVTLNKKLMVGDLEQVIPYKLARSIIIENPDDIILLDCPCRVARPKSCKPIDVCLIIGAPFSEFVYEHHRDRCRKISHEEAVAVLEAEHKRGHVHHAFFKSDLLGRFYAICNCCSCCCGAIQAWRNGTPMLASSGFISRVDEEKCVTCGICAAFCQFDAIKKVDDRLEFDESLCLGCGVCVTKCKEEARWLERDPARGEPLEVNKLIQESDKQATHKENQY